MTKLKSTVDKLLQQMGEVGGTGKGNFGEQAVFKICEERYQAYGGILYHSYSYKTDPACEGNIKRSEQGNLFIENLGKTTEIDVLLVTKNKVFPIEVKAYKAKKIILTDDAIIGCFRTDKSPVHQNEMHCRHLYSAIFKVLPEGETRYIEPIVVFVDNCTIEDNRSEYQKQYIKVTVLNHLKKLLNDLDKPLDYFIDLKMMEKCLLEIGIKFEKHLKTRII